MKSTSTFEDLEVWQKGRDLRRDLSQLVKQLPTDEKFRLADQILRASRSVTANIVHPVEYYDWRFLLHTADP